MYVFRKILIAMTLCAAATNQSLAKSGSEKFSCFGKFANIVSVPESGDLLGLELIINRPDNVKVFMYEGAKVAAQVTDVKIDKNVISLGYNGIEFHGACHDGSIIYSGYDWKTGKPPQLWLFVANKSAAKRGLP